MVACRLLDATPSRMSNIVRWLSLSLVSLSAAACMGTTDVDADTDEDVDQAEAELVTANIKSISVGKSAGFRPPPAPGSCHPAGRWDFDFTSRKLTGNACVNGVPTTVSKTVTTSEAAKIRSAVSGVRVTARPPACPTDMPVASLTVKRAQSQKQYIDARASCGGSSTPVREATLDKLVTLLESLSSAAPACVRSGCSGQICADQAMFSTCEWRPEYACYQQAICERGANGQCGFRQTPQLAACLGE